MKKILILEANPHQDLSLDKEIRSLRSVIDDAGDRSKFRIKDGAAVRKDQLQDLLLGFEAEERKDDPIIVHFCGHGTGEKGLVFEDRQGNSDLVSTKTLTDFFALFEKRVACVVMNACYSEVQAKAINKHIKYVIGMNQAIRDDAAIAFSIGFYRALGYGKSIEDSFKFGKNAIQLAIEDSTKSRVDIAEDIRKLVPIDDVSEAIITQEHLKPVIKVNPDIKFIVDNESRGELSPSQLGIRKEEKLENIPSSDFEFPLEQSLLDEDFETLCLSAPKILTTEPIDIYQSKFLYIFSVIILVLLVLIGRSLYLSYVKADSIAWISKYTEWWQIELARSFLFFGFEIIILFGLFRREWRELFGLEKTPKEHKTYRNITIFFLIALCITVTIIVFSYHNVDAPKKLAEWWNGQQSPRISG